MPLQSHQNPIVHVVDDDPSMLEALQNLFLSIGLETRTYSTARDFLAAPVADGPSCLVIDIRLPDMSGLECQMQLTQSGVRLPVIMMTGYGDIPMSVRAEARRSGLFSRSPSKIRICSMRCWRPSKATGIGAPSRAMPDGLYAGVARSNAMLQRERMMLERALGAQRRERDARLMTGDVVTAMIAHEVKQPLARHDNEI